jgi:hypothetical protein
MKVSLYIHERPRPKNQAMPSCVLWTMVERKAEGTERLELDICTYRKSDPFYVLTHEL